MNNNFKKYYELVKPGIVYGNAIVAAAAFVYASKGPVDWGVLLFTLIGLSFVVGSACIINNYVDRFIDAKMERTKHRALATGAVKNSHALIISAILLILGIIALHHHVNDLALLVALIGWFLYVASYTPLKHLTPHALWVGALSGATPPVVGYVAVTNAFDMTALWLFLFLFLWQIPHFLAIAVYRNEEYQNARVPVIMKGPYSDIQKRRARQIFLGSLVVLLGWCLVLILQR
ncbi:heme o synthase [Candidatus Parcubacteria bacterium]|nr:heme o synthase [Candidatus Parcubacteria bacterium]